MADIVDEQDIMSKKLETLESNLSALNNSHHKLQERVRRQEEHSKSSNILIYNLESQIDDQTGNETDSELRRYILHALNKVAEKVLPHRLKGRDIADFHRIRSNKDPKPVVVRLVSAWSAKRILMNGRYLKGLNENRAAAGLRGLHMEVHRDEETKNKRGYLLKCRSELLHPDVEKDHNQTFTAVINFRTYEMVINGLPYRINEFPRIVYDLKICKPFNFRHN